MFTTCDIVHSRCCRPVAGNTDTAAGLQQCRCVVPKAVYTVKKSAPEDGRNHRPKLAELIGIVNKPLLLHLVGCLHYKY